MTEPYRQPLKIEPGACSCTPDGRHCACAPSEERIAELTDQVIQSRFAVNAARVRGDKFAAARHLVDLRAASRELSGDKPTPKTDAELRVARRDALLEERAILEGEIRILTAAREIVRRLEVDPALAADNKILIAAAAMVADDDDNDAKEPL